MRDKEKHREACRRWARENPERAAAKSLRAYYNNHEANKARRRARYAANPTKQLKLAKDYYAQNREKRNAANKVWASEHREEKLGYNQAYYAANAERLRRMSIDWAKNNPEKARLRSLRRTMRQKALLHPQADNAKMLRFYKLARKLTKETGTEYQVDHIIPLSRGGWHHQGNMQILPSAVNNRKKSNPFWELEGYKSWRDVPYHLWPEKLRPEYAKRSI